ncbi:hypothetical protein TsFJ059_008649 [Trichoderma semiorbis]|uniref:Uncharacterized protein n=1 Tax=Trichoderma semiorbis TaxID=1491008 RepID=A0A9P8HEH5_9HYPO|nr:hypothetical protein TsFJ059_008649 [Trichoderma semiorbis]
MTSSKPIASRPYVPGGLVLSDLKKYQHLERFYTQNMGFIEQARKLLSHFSQSLPDLKNTTVEPRPSKNEHPKWTWKPLRGRAFRLSGIRGKKRKRESDDGGFHPQKSRLLEGGEIKHVTEEEIKYDDVKPRSLREILYPELEFWGIDPADWPTFALEELEAEKEKERKKREQEKEQESFGDSTSDLSETLDNLTIIDDDDDISMRTPYTSPEFDNDSEVSMMESISDWGDWYRARRRDSDSSITLPLGIDVDDVDMDELPIDSGGTLNELISLLGQAPVVPEGFIMNEFFGLPGQDPFIPGDVILEESFPPGQAPVIPEDIILQEVFPAPDHAPVVPEDVILKESFTPFRQASLFPQDIILKESFPPPDNAPAISGDVIPQDSFTPFRQASLFSQDITLKESFPAPDHAPVVFEDIILKDSFPPPGYAPAVPEDVILKELAPPPGQATVVPQDVILQDVFPATNHASAVSEGFIMNHLFPLPGQAPSLPEGVIFNEPFPPPVQAPVVPVDARLKEVFAWQEYRMEAAPGPECSMGMNGEAEEANDDASMKTASEASWETATERGIGAEREVEAENKAAAQNEAEAETKPEFRPYVGIEVEETGTRTAVSKGKGKAGKRSYEEFGETEIEDADAGASGEETDTVKATVGKRTYEEFEEDEIDDADAGASGEETRIIRVLERTETETETADYRTQVEEAEEKKCVKEADDVEGMEAREPTPEDAMDGLEEMTSEIAHMNIVASEPERAPSTPIPPSTPTPVSNPMRKPRSSVSAGEPEPAPSTPTPASRSMRTLRSSVPESAVAAEVADEKADLELALREMQSLADQVDNIAECYDYDYGIELCEDCHQIDVDIAEHIRDVRERITEELLVIEQKLRPYCVGE